MNLASYILIFKDWMQTDSLNVFANLLSILFAHDFIVVSKHFLVFGDEALDVAVEMVRLNEQPFENFDTQILANLQDVRVFSDHFSKDDQVCTASCIPFQVILKY